ncbi:hypothetical protein CL658_02455 [bacterium]|nr:hypothetical protein [bacterium]|tara:strand:- start:2107 stop:2727 length:621 start_codon:yes stop_codon:yes gene_type:complete
MVHKKNNFQKRIKYYLIFLLVSIATYVILSPEALSTSFITVILFGLSVGLSLAFFFSMIVSRDKSYIRSLQDQEQQNHSIPLKNIESSVNQLSKTLDNTVTMLSKKQTPSSAFQSLPLNFSIIPSSHSDTAYILDNELKIPFQDSNEKSIYNKLVRLLKKNGHHIRILKPYNPSFDGYYHAENEDDNDLAFNAIHSDFPQNLINFN